MSEFILVWVLMVRAGSSGDYTYSPPVKTLEDCQKMQVFITENRFVQTKTQCIQINILKRGDK